MIVHLETIYLGDSHHSGHVQQYSEQGGGERGEERSRPADGAVQDAQDSRVDGCQEIR